MVVITYEIKDQLGLHARPASALVQTASKLGSKITVQCGDRMSDGKKLIALMRLGIKYKDEVTFIVEGESEEEDSIALQEFCQMNL